MAPRTIWQHNEKRTIWHLGQFGTTMKRGQFGTTVENEQFGNLIKSDRESQHLQFKYYAVVVCAPFRRWVGECLFSEIYFPRCLLSEILQ